MKYIKTYESFKDESQINEEFIGKIFKNLKNKLSLGFSKMFGSAQEVDKLMEQYKKEVTLAQQKKKVSLTTMGEYFKSIVNGGEKDPNKVKELKKNIELADKNYDNQIKVIKQKFDLKFDEVVKGEKNEKIKNYIQLKKLEMQQELLQGEMESLLSGDMKSEDIDDPDFKSILSEMEKKTQETIKLTEEQKKELESKKEVVVGFDIDKAKQMASKGEVYTWEKSPFYKYEFPDGDKIKFFSQTNTSETKPVSMPAIERASLKLTVAFRYLLVTKSEDALSSLLDAHRLFWQPYSFLCRS